MEWKLRRKSGSRWIVIVATAGICAFVARPAILHATHEADHRYTVEGFVCTADGKPSANTEVLVKDTRISYGQTVTTDDGGYYRAAFHLHNDNLGDPLLVEVKGEQQHHKIQFDPKDLESERKIQVNFGSGCIVDRSAAPAWLWVGLASVGGVIALLIGVKVARSQRKRGGRQEKGQGRRKK
ncbi:MAG: carboxypeptidase regulatory-like domain-containing protein [Nitrospira sp.]|nr:carboxypeptidase regulatory-like domain-containing protein [Nitrospira sp.]